MHNIQKNKNGSTMLLTSFEKCKKISGNVNLTKKLYIAWGNELGNNINRTLGGGTF